jgi:hypothetical protein
LVISKEYGHPYGSAEQVVEDGDSERGSEQYQRLVVRMKATRQSSRDFAHQIDCCLWDDSVTYGIDSAVSDNNRRWFSIQRTRKELGYSPVNTTYEWDEPPTHEPA